MPTKAWRNCVTDNEGEKDGPTHLIQCTGIGPGDRDCVAWTSLWLPKRIPRKFMDRNVQCGFCATSGTGQCKTSPPSSNADFTTLRCAYSNELCGRRFSIFSFGVEDMNYEDVYERVAEVANDIGRTISNQKTSACKRLPCKNPVSGPLFANFVRRETNFRVMAH